jgi:hypothetical protein
MHGIYNYVPETNYISEVYNVRDVLWLQFMVLRVMIFPVIIIVIIIIIIVVVVVSGFDRLPPSSAEFQCG